MHFMLRFSVLPGLLLLAGASFALAESPLPDPVAPAVIGRPLDQIKPARPARDKAAAKRPGQAKARAAATTQAARVPKPAPPAFAPGPAQATQATQATPHPARQALDDRADPRVRAPEVGKGTRFARKPLQPGAYIGDRHRSAVRKYFEQHPVAGTAAHWQIGERVPRGARLAPVPPALLASLPQLPPGHQYVQLGGDVVLMAAGSRMVVDGVSRASR